MSHIIAKRIHIRACVATVRGALEPVDGVSKIEITEGKKPFKVTYDPSKVTIDDLLEKLASAGETAKKKG